MRHKSLYLLHLSKQPDVIKDDNEVLKVSDQNFKDATNELRCFFLQDYT